MRGVPCDAVLFDCDGVLVDSRATAERAWTEWARYFDLDPAEVFRGLHGRRSQDTVQRHLPPSEWTSALELIERIELRTAADTKPIPGALALFTELVERCAVVTSATRTLARERLRAAGFPRPPILIAGPDVQRGKPAPSGYVLAAERVSVDINRCAVVEDSPAGVAAARAAGASGVAIVGGRVAATLADLSVSDLRGLSWTGGALTLVQL